MNANTAPTTVYGSKSLHFGESTNIRLIELLLDDASQSTITSLISCKLHVISLDKSPPYICLSYVWGDPAITRTILIDGQPFTVRENLYSFLAQMNREKNTGLFWIDAICIDQSSILERNHQVGLMGKIYSEATKVIAWLGAGSEPISKAIQNIGIMLPLERDDIDNWSSLVDHLDTICTSDYWSRIWIVQEFILGKEVEIQCSDHKIRSNILNHIMIIGQGYHGLMEVSPSESNDGWFDFTNSTEGWRTLAERVVRCRSSYHNPKDVGQVGDWREFRVLFEAFRTMDCADVRDRVYALLSLVEPKGLSRLPILPDYAKSTTQLFSDLMHRRYREVSVEYHGEVSVEYHGEVRSWLLQKFALALYRGLKLADDDPVVKHALAMIEQGKPPNYQHNVEGTLAQSGGKSWRSSFKRPSESRGIEQLFKDFDNALHKYTARRDKIAALSPPTKAPDPNTSSR